MTNRRIFLAGALAALAPLAGTRGAWAADAFPQRPIKLVVPNPPGVPRTSSPASSPNRCAPNWASRW